MATEHDPAILARIADYAWGLVLAVLLAVGRWVYGHEQRVTRLEAQHEECERSRVRTETALDGLSHEIKGISSKLDRILGHIGHSNANSD